jgi:repressor LexA
MMTPRQAELLAYIRRYRETEDIAPSVREIAKALGVTAATIQRHLDALEDTGVIRRSPGIPRSIRILEETVTPVPLQ